MDGILNPPVWLIKIGNWQGTINAETLIMTWLAMGFLIFGSLIVMHNPKLIPGPVQSVVEMIFLGFYRLSAESLGVRGTIYFFPLVLTLFLFIITANWMGMIPYLSEPTRDLNTTLALGLISIVTAHGWALKTKGVRGYFRSYFKPFSFMFLLNLIGEFAKVLSLSFRLFGNIMGGAVIILVVSGLVRQLVLPPFLQLFFGVFVGAVQAFVFTMLTITYISLAAGE
jgi:F-type H+-transporting ATPase subunit a